MYTAYTYWCLLMHLCFHLHFAKVLAREERDEQAQCAARDLLHGYALHCWISIYCMEHPAGLCACAACAVTKWRSRLTVWLHDWWLVGLCMTLHGLIRSYFIIWCAIDYTMICPSENHYGDQSIWFSILDVPWGCDIDPEDIFPEARRAVKARGAGRSWLSDDETGIEHQSRIDWHMRSSLLSLNGRPDLQMTTEWHLKDFEWSLTLELPW